MAVLFLRDQPVPSVFSLLGETENDISFTVGWALSRSPFFLSAVLKEVFGRSVRGRNEQINITLQKYKRKGGITDVEITTSDIHVIIEAKKGWHPAERRQLRLYLQRFRRTKPQSPRLVTVSECGADYAREYGVQKMGRVAVRHISWKRLTELSNFRRGTQAEKRLMKEFRTYMGTVINMQNEESNRVYVVSLGRKEWAKGLTFIDTVTKRRRYFHRYGGVNGWPKEPPNYLAFRYYGKLQSIHHVEGWTLIRNFHKYFSESPSYEEKHPYFLYKLGPPIVPAADVQAGRVKRGGSSGA
jgi:hypothetical protein